MNYQQVLWVKTYTRGAIEVTSLVDEIITQSGGNYSLCHVFVTHTSVSLMVTANEDPDLLLDIEDFLAKMVDDSNPNYRHNNADSLDVAGHLRSILTAESKTIPVQNAKLALGKFQGLFLYEQRAGMHNRKLIVTLL